MKPYTKKRNNWHNPICMRGRSCFYSPAKCGSLGQGLQAVLKSDASAACDFLGTTSEDAAKRRHYQKQENNEQSVPKILAIHDFLNT